MMQSIVICSLPLEWFVAHNALRAMGSNRMRRFLIFLKELMQGAHYYAALPRIFIYLISFAEKCITRLLIGQTSCTSIGKNVENNFSASTGPGEPKNGIKKNNNAENTSGKNLLVAVSSEKGKIASVKVNWPQHWCCSQPGTGQLYIPNKVSKSQMSSIA